MFAVIDYGSAKSRRWRSDHSIGVKSLFTLQDFDLKLHRNPPPPPQEYRSLWSTKVPGGFPFYVVPKSAPVLAEGRVFRGCDAGKMHAFDPATGAIVWEYATTGATKRKGIWSTPAYHDGRLYFGAYNGVAYCLDAGTGSEIWTQSYGEWIGASPLVIPHHNLVCFGLEYERPWARGSIGALDLQTGQKRWEHLIEKYQHGSPAYWAGGDLVVWGSADHDMLGLDAATGKIRWSFRTGRSVKYAPAICEARGIAAFASFDRSIYVLDLRTGSLLGQWKTGEICYTTPLIHRGRLFCGSGDRHLYVIDLDDLALIRKLDFGSRIYSSPVALGDRVVFGTSGGKVIELDVASLEIKGQLQLPDAVTNAVAVAPDGRRMFVSTYMNTLHAFERIGASGTGL
jgi:outer membrane protein assembly factor BamB